MSYSVHLIAGALSALLFAGDPFLFLAPQVRLSPVERRSLAAGAIVARTLESGPGQVAVFSVTRAEVSPQTLIDSARRIEDLKRSALVTGIQRFSNPPRVEDLDALQLTPRDLAALAACRPGACSFKLTADEIDLLRDEGGEHPSTDALLTAFRRVVLARVNAYLAGGLGALPPTANRPPAVCLDQVFRELATASPLLPHARCAAEWLREFPDHGNHVESFLYWSYETYGTGKPVVVVTHVGLIPPAAPGDPAIVLGKQVMATRYMTGGLSLLAVTTDQATGTNYLVYLNRTGVDLLGGFFGPLKRAALESRLKRELPEIIQKLRTRLEQTPSTTR